jgi:porin
LSHSSKTRRCSPKWLLAFCGLLFLTFCSQYSFAQTDSQTTPPAPASASPPPPAPRQYALGDWGGERTRLANKGVTFDFFYVADLLSNPVGGLTQRNTGWGRIRGTVDVDFGKLTGWHGLTFHATGLWQFGTNLGANIGSIANPSGLVSAHTTRLDSFWLQQSFLHDRLFLRAGQFAGLDFYGVQEYGGSYVIEPLDYALGNLFPTTFESFNPAATPAAEIRVIPWRTLYVKAAVLSGNRDPYNQDTTGFNFQIKDSPVFVDEIGYFINPIEAPGDKPRKTYPGHYKFGSAYNAGKFPNAQGVEYPGNYLIYAGANQAVYRTSAGSTQGLDLLAAWDWSPPDANRQNTQTTLGARYNGPFSARPQDSVAFAFIYSRIADPYRAIGISPGLPLLGSEKAIELNYAAYIRPYLLFQPVFQYYDDVGANSHIPNAAVFGFRAKVDF